MTTMDGRINIRTSDNRTCARTTSLIAIRKFRNVTHSHGWVSGKPTNSLTIQTQHTNMITRANNKVERRVYDITV